MAFSVRSGLALVCLIALPFFLAQAHPRHKVPQPKGSGHIIPTCCVTVSKAPIDHQINACFEQKENTFAHCKVHAYIFVKGDNVWCSDPTAWWIPQRLERLRQRGINCTILSHYWQ